MSKNNSIDQLIKLLWIPGSINQINQSIDQATFNESINHLSINRELHQPPNQSISCLSINIYRVSQWISQSIKSQINFQTIFFMISWSLFSLFACLSIPLVMWQVEPFWGGQFVITSWETFLVSWFPQWLHFMTSILWLCMLWMFVAMQWCSHYCVAADCGFLHLFLAIFIRWHMHISWCHSVLSSHFHWFHIFIVSCVDCTAVMHLINQWINLPIKQSVNLFLSLFSPWFVSFKSFPLLPSCFPRQFSSIFYPSNHSPCIHFTSCVDTFSTTLISFFTDLVVCLRLPFLLGSHSHVTH